MARIALVMFCVAVAACDSFTDPPARKLAGEVAAIANGSRYLMHECNCTFVVEDFNGDNPRGYSLRFFTPDSLNSESYSELRYSNDGKGILALHRGSARNSLVMMRPLGAAPVIISAPDESAVMGDWAPGDSLIVYPAFTNRVILEGRSSRATLSYRVYDVRTGARRTIVQNRPFGSVDFHEYVRFSADGQKIFGAQKIIESPGRLMLHEADVATGTVRIIAEVPYEGRIIHIDRSGDRVWVIPSPRGGGPAREPLIRYDVSTKTALSFGVVAVMEITNDDQYVAAGPFNAGFVSKSVGIFTKNGELVGYVPAGQSLFITSAR